MSADERLLTITVPAAGDLSANQYLFHKIDTSGNLAICGIGNATDGVLQNAPNAAALAATLGFMGVSKVKVGAAGVTAGDLVMSDAAGKATTAVASASRNVVGKALKTGVSGDIVPVLLRTNSVLA